MDPFRDELAAAHARIAVLEATLATLRPKRTSNGRMRVLGVSILVVAAGLLMRPPAETYTRASLVSPVHTWNDHLPYAWDVDDARVGASAPWFKRIDCFSGEYECR